MPSNSRRKEVAGGEKMDKQRPLRRQIRDTTRLLSKEHLPETVRQTKERVLKSLKQELTEKLNQKRIKRISKKYRMVKFFEKRKVSRKLKTKIKLCDGCSPEYRAELEEAIARLRMELNYVTHYPEVLKYRALYPTTETTSAKSISRREDQLAAISKRVTDGELPDASLEICLALPCDDGKISKVVESPVAEVDRKKGSRKVSRTKESPTAEVDRMKGSRKARRKTGPVKEESGSDVESAGRNLCEDDFFLDTVGNLNT